MYQQDYILRQIEMLGAFLRRMLDAITMRQPDEALRIVDEALTEIGVGPDLVDSLPAEGLLAMLSAGGELDAPRAALLGMALTQRADALEAGGFAEEAARDRSKGEVLLRAAAPGLDATTRAALELLPRSPR